MSLSANQIRTELFMRLNNAQVHHDLLDSLRDATRDDENLRKFNHNLRFFAGVEGALFNSSVVLLYSVHETRKDTINFHQLLRQMAVEKFTFPLDDYQSRLGSMKPAWIRLNILRNEMVGHQSLNYERAAIEAKASLSFGDFKQLLSESKSLLFDISSACFDTHLEFMSSSRLSVSKLLSRIAL